MMTSNVRRLLAALWAGLLASALVSGTHADLLPQKPLAAPVRKAARDVEPRSHVVAAPAPKRAPITASEPTAHGPYVPARWTPTPGFVQAAHPAQHAAARVAARGGNSWALLIGINQYRAPTRDNVGSYQDATALRSYLLSLGWRPDHILLVANTEATRDHVVAALQWLASKTDDASTVVFHYSGHELPYHRDVDGDGEAMDVALWLSDNSTLVDGDLGKLLGPVRAHHMWINFAVCRAAGFSDPGTVRSGRVVTYSSQQSEFSYEDPSRAHSVFGYFSIVEGMQSGGADANGDGVTTVQEAFSYAQPRVTDFAKQYGDSQHPSMDDHLGEPFSLVAPAPPPPPAPEPTPSSSPCTNPLGCR